MRSMRPGVPLAARLGAVTGAAVLATMPTIGPAAAGETRSWTNKDVLPATPGYAATSLTVSFPSKRAVDIKGWVEDRCDADGYGAYVYAYRTAATAGSTSTRARTGRPRRSARSTASRCTCARWTRTPPSRRTPAAR